MEQCCPLNDVPVSVAEDIEQWYDEELTIIGLVAAGMALATLTAVSSYILCMKRYSMRRPYDRVETNFA